MLGCPLFMGGQHKTFSETDERYLYPFPEMFYAQTSKKKDYGFSGVQIEVKGVVTC